MRLSVTIVLLCIGLTMAQWPCQDWGFNGPIPNCASCQYYGSIWGSASSNYQIANGPNLISGTSSSVLAYTVCTTCTTGFYLQQSACLPCPQGCLWCNSNGACNPLGCGVGFVFNPVLSTCVACPAALNCTTCVYSNNIPGNSLIPQANFGSTFQPVTGGVYQPTGGLSSISSGPYVCTSCGTGFYQSTAGACVACPANTQTCSMGTFTQGSSNSGNLQVVCNSGFFPTIGNPICTACLANCATCTTSTTCTQCQSGYFLAAGPTCTACGANCLTCATATTCTNTGCAAGFVTNAAGACVATTAIANCATYDGTTPATPLCVTCLPGFFVAVNQLSCIACPLNCSTASGSCLLNSGTGATYCTRCQANFTLVATLLFSVQGSNVQTANSIQGGTCIPLPANCLNGQPATSSATIGTCLQCYPGYGLVVNITTNVTSCQQCPAGCLHCDGLGVCTQCNITTVLVPNQCLQCPYNCSVCANATYCYNNCTKNYNYNAATGQCLPNGTERLIMAGFALISLFLYFL